jgi:hypothetical protein
MKPAILAAVLLMALSSSTQNSQPSTNIRVPDEAAALRIAAPALIRVYGKRQIDYERPLTAVLENGVWKVHGTLCCPDREGRRMCEVGRCVGGVAEVKVRQSDSRILSISHGK